MSKRCSHIAGIKNVTPSALGCEECLKSGSAGCICGSAVAAAMSAAATIPRTSTRPRISMPPAIPIIEGYDPPEGWGWCYVDEAMFDLSDRKTPHNGPIPRYY